MPDANDYMYNTDYEEDLNIKNFEKITKPTSNIMLIGYDANRDVDIQISAALLGGGSGGSGTMDYSELFNLPSINGVELNGNLVSGDLNLQSKLEYYSESKNQITLSAVVYTSGNIIAGKDVYDAYGNCLSQKQNILFAGDNIEITPDGFINAIIPDIPSGSLTEEEVNTLIDNKTSEFVSKTEVETIIDTKLENIEIPEGDSLTEEEVNTLIDNKLNNVYIPSNSDIEAIVDTKLQNNNNLLTSIYQPITTKLSGELFGSTDEYISVENALSFLRNNIGGEGGTSDYNLLTNIPSINAMPIKNNITFIGDGVDIITDEENNKITFKVKGLTDTDKSEITSGESSIINIDGGKYIPFESNILKSVDVDIYAASKDRSSINKAIISFLIFKDPESGLTRTSDAIVETTLSIGKNIINIIDADLNEELDGVELKLEAAEDVEVWTKTNITKYDVSYDSNEVDTEGTEEPNNNLPVLINGAKFIPFIENTIQDVDIDMFISNTDFSHVTKVKVKFLMYKDPSTGLIKTSDATADTVLIIGKDILNQIDVEVNESNTGVEVLASSIESGKIITNTKINMVETK